MKSYGKVSTTGTALIVRDHIRNPFLNPYTETIGLHITYLLQRFDQQDTKALAKDLESRTSLRK